MSTTWTKKIGDLALTFQPGGGKSPKWGVLSVSRDGQKLKSHTFNLANENSRIAFIDGLLKDHPEIAPESRVDLLGALLNFDAANWTAVETIPTEDKPAEFIPFEGVTGEELHAAMDMLESDNLVEQLERDFKALGITGESKLTITIYLIMVSRLLKKPIAAIVMALSSTGKSFVLETIAKTMPPEAIVLAHEMSDKVLYYMDPGSLIHRVVVAGERVHSQKGADGQAEDASKAWREMAASGFLTKVVTTKDGKGKLVARKIRQEGPVAFLESTTASQLFEEDSTRMLKLTMDESAEQTENIMDGQGDEGLLMTPSEQEINKIIRRHHIMQRLLQYCDVGGDNLPHQPLPPPRIRIPFIKKITLPSNVISSRRMYSLLISFIRAVALLRRFHSSKKQVASAGQKPQSDGDRIIEADLEDYRIAYDLIQPVISEMYAPLPAKVLELLEIIKENSGTPNESITLGDGRKTKPASSVIWNEFTVSDCEKWGSLSERTLYRRIWPAVSARVLSVNKAAQPYKFRLIYPDLASAAKLKVAIGLPTPEELVAALSSAELDPAEVISNE